MKESTPSLSERLALAFRTFYRLLADPTFAERLQLAAEAPPALPAASETAHAAQSANAEPERAVDAALQLLGILQREGRFVDFVQQDIAAFPDADVGAAARVVHQGCRAALSRITTIEPIQTANEGSALVLEADYDPKAYRLLGTVQGKPPYRGTLRHRGWRVTRLELEEPLTSADLRIVAQAEVEL